MRQTRIPLNTSVLASTLQEGGMTSITEPQDERGEFPTREQIESRAYEIYLKRGEGG